MTIRYPREVSPWLNLMKLLTPASWAWTLASLITVALCFNVASLVVRRWMGMRLENIEIDLWPFRLNMFALLIYLSLPSPLTSRLASLSLNFHENLKFT